MIITVKCPNCNAQVASTNVHCIFCGVSLRDAAPVDRPAVSAEPVTRLYCPKGHVVSNPALGFCDCGERLVETPPEYVSTIPTKSSGSSSSPGYAGGYSRTCPRGHAFKDPSLRHCPICGLGFTDSVSGSSASEDRWPCGHLNSPGTAFCTTCGSPRAGADSYGSRAGADSYRPEKRFVEPSFIPDGMYSPTDEDLRRK